MFTEALAANVALIMLTILILFVVVWFSCWLRTKRVGAVVVFLLSFSMLLHILIDVDYGLFHPEIIRCNSWLIWMSLFASAIAYGYVAFLIFTNKLLERR